LVIFTETKGVPAKARQMYERAAKGYEEVEGDHEADITYLQQQLSILAVTDRAADRHYHLMRSRVFHCCYIY
jgi:hypothetical protein